MIGSPFMLLINLQIPRKNKKNFLNCKKKVSFIPKKVPFIPKVKKQVKVCYSIYEKKNLIKCYFILI